MNVIEISSGGDVSDTSSCIGVVDSKNLNVDPLVVVHPLPNLIIFNDSSEANEGSIKYDC